MKKSFLKFQILVTKKGSENLMKGLQELGLLHIETEKIEQKELSAQQEQAGAHRDRLKRVVELLEAHEQAKEVIPKIDVDVDRAEAITTILSLGQEIDKLSQQLESYRNEEERLKTWGNFDDLALSRIRNKGYHIYLCHCPEKVFRTLDLSNFYFAIQSTGNANVYFTVFTKQHQLSLPVEFFEAPADDYLHIREKAVEVERRIEKLKLRIASYRSLLPGILNDYLFSVDAVQYHAAYSAVSSRGGGRVVGIMGWVPAKRAGEVRSFLESRHIAYMDRGPLPGEDVPVILQNQKYSRLFEPITKIFELPNYHEVDPTPFIAVFYPILFAYCLGDAGYGAVLLLAAIVSYFTFLKNGRNLALLGIILGAATTVMGLVKSGSLFGLPLNLDQDAEILKWLGQFVLIPDDSDFIFNAFNVALMIGVVQILTGILISIYNKAVHQKSLIVLSAVGKLLIVSSLIWIFLADMQEMEALQPGSMVRYGFLLLGIAFVIFFHEMESPLLKRAASSVMPLFFIFTGILGDILSFVRLFALGLASSVLGLVVNQIAMQIMSGGILAIITGVLFLLFGHSLNFGIAALGSFVHPLRLTFVEFYGNANFQGKGVQYRPFQKSIKTVENT